MASKPANGTRIKLSNVDELFNLGGTEEKDGQIRELPLDDLHPFSGHPFKVLDDDKMQDMVQSIREYGVLNPLLVRPKGSGGYELISGHRRKHACEIAGIKTAPCMVREIDDDEAVLLMVDSNIQREELLYSEKAFAYKMKLDAMKRRAGRPRADGGQNGSQVGNHLEKGVKSIDVMADEVNESKNQIHRYIRLTELLPVLLERVDSRKIPFGVGVELSYLDHAGQEVLLRVMDRLAVVPNLAQAGRLKQLGKDGELDEKGIVRILSKEKAQPGAFRLERKKIDGYFPAGYTDEQKERLIYELLQEWRLRQGDGEQE
ncbi:MAG: ParB/RepB/Spo0J family partition protein [Blautia sp.]|nr:ParB/RepB/Spo0J family partition protein [Blautia sp.]